MSDILGFADNGIAIAAGVDILDAINALSAGWGQMHVDDAASFAEILANGSDRFLKPEVKAAAEAAHLGDAYATVADALAAIRKFTQADAGRAVLRLLSRVDQFRDDSSVNSDSDPGLVRWSPAPINVAASNSRLSFEAGADATLALEAGDLWPYRSDIVGDPGLDGLIRIQIDGNARAGAMASLPLQSARLSGEVAATLKSSIAWYVTPAAPSQIFAEAVAAAVPRLPLPTRFDALWKAVQTSNLKGAILSIDGTIVMKGEIALATDGVIAGIGGVGAAVTVKAEIIRASSFQISARAIGKPGGGAPRPITVSVSSAKSRQSTLGIDFSVKLDATDLREKTAAIVRNVISEWDDRLKPLEKFLSPGTLLRDELATQLNGSIDTMVGNASLKAALQAEARRALGLEPGEAELKTWLNGVIIDAVSSEAGKVQQGASAAIDGVIARIPVAGLQAEAATLLRTELKKLLAAFDDGLKTAVGQIVTGPAASVADLVARFGVNVDQAVDTIDGKLASVRKLLAHFNALLDKIAVATEKAANYRLQILFATETATREWSEFLFAGTFSQDTPATRALFDNLVAGRVDRVADLLQGGNAVPGVSVDKARSFALRGKSWSQSTSFGLFVIGFEISSKQLLTAEAEVRATADGIVVTGKAGAAVIDKRPDGTQIVRLSNPYSLAVGTGSDPREPVIRLMLDINRFENNLKEGELADFLGSLVTHGLLSSWVPSQALAVLRRWQPIGGGNSDVPGRVEVGFALDSAAVARLYRRSERNNRRLSHAADVDIVQKMLDSLLASKAISAKDLAVGLSFALSAIPGEPKTSNAANLLYMARYDKNWDLPNFSSGIDQSRFERIIGQFGGIGADGYPVKGRMLPFLDALDALADLALASMGPPDNWQRDDYLKATRHVSEGLAPWLGNNRKLLKLDDTVTPQLIAFMLLVRSLAQLPTGSIQSASANALPTAPLYLVMSRGSKGDEDRTVLV